MSWTKSSTSPRGTRASRIPWTIGACISYRRANRSTSPSPRSAAAQCLLRPAALRQARFVLDAEKDRPDAILLEARALAERLVGELLEADDIVIGMPLEVTFEPTENGGAVPVFRSAGADENGRAA